MAVAIMSNIIRNDPSLSQRNIDICSAGTGAIRGNAAHLNSQETMREWGFNIDNHRALPLNRDTVDRADLIVSLDNYVSEDIERSFPGQAQSLTYSPGAEMAVSIRNGRITGPKYSPVANESFSPHI